QRRVRRMLFTTVITALCLIYIPLTASAGGSHKKFTFEMVPSGAAKNCLPGNPGAHVRLEDKGQVQKLHVEVFGLPPNTTFTLFIIQVPKSPFGLVWYRADIDTNEDGRGEVAVAGIFSDETFIMAPGVAPAPLKFKD